MTWPRVYLGVCLLLLALTLWLLWDAVRLGLSPWPRVLGALAWLALTWRAWQAVRGEGKGRQP